MPNLHLIPCQPVIFMQDNGPCHRAKKVMSYFEEESINLMDCPAQSVTNPIDNIWKIIGESSEKTSSESRAFMRFTERRIVGDDKFQVFHGTNYVMWLTMQESDGIWRDIH